LLIKGADAIGTVAGALKASDKAVGMIASGIKIADDVVDTAKTAKKVSDAVQDAELAAKSIDKISDAGKSAAKVAGDLKGVAETGNYKIINRYTAEEVNKWFVDNVKPDYKPPYKLGTFVNEIELTQDAIFVRVYDNIPGGSGMYGSWVMKPEDVEGLTAKQIQDKFALPNIPKYICDVKIDAGIHMRVGEANKIDGWGNGGGTQYDLMGQRVGIFTNERFIK
jgi:hypothetical protein